MASPPLDMVFPISSILFSLIDCALIVIAIMLSDYIISHRIEVKKILLMSVIAYIFVPILISLMNPYLPSMLLQIPYLLPLIFWIILGEFILTEIDIKRKALIAAMGFVISTLMYLIGIQTLIIMYIRI